MKEALHPEFDGHGDSGGNGAPGNRHRLLNRDRKRLLHRPASGELDVNNLLIQNDLAHPQQPKSAIGYIVEALNMRREQGLKAFTVLSCDNAREWSRREGCRPRPGESSRCRPAAWIADNVTFPCTMVDRIVPAATEETLQLVADQLGVYDPCAIACEPFRQWVIEDNFVNGRPDWDTVGAQFVADVVPFEMMKLRMLNGSHSFLAYLGYLGGYDTIADTTRLTRLAVARRWR